MRGFGRSRSTARARAALAMGLVIAFIVPSLAGAYLDLPDCRTGAPGESTCRSCHGSYGLNSGGGYISLSGLPEKFEVTRSYVVTATVYSPGMSRWLFEVTAKAELPDHSFGAFTCIDSGQTVVSGAGRYVKNTRAGCGGAVDGVKTWQFQWNAPSSADSNIAFYACGMGSNGGGTGGDRVYTCSMTIMAPPKIPSKPLGIIGEAGDSMASLNWFMPEETAYDRVSYNIYWSDRTDGGLELLTTVNSTEYIHTGLENGRTYRYQVSGWNAEGDGPLSDQVTVVPGAVPDQPRHLEASVNDEGDVVLSWDEPSSWGSGQNHAYNIYRGENPWSMVALESGVTVLSYVDDGVPVPNMVYHYRVSTVSTVGMGRSTFLEIDVPPSTPGFPLGLSATSRLGNVELSWEPPAEDGGDPVTCYKVYRSQNGGEPKLLAEDILDTFYMDELSVPEVIYEYTVSAMNCAGEGAVSTPIEVSAVAAPSAGEENYIASRGIPYMAVGLTFAVALIGVAMVGRLSVATRRRESRRD